LYPIEDRESKTKKDNLMKTMLKYLALAILLAINFQLSTVAQGTAFMYQGSLSSNGAPVNGSFDLTFALFTTNSGGSAIEGPVTNLNITVSNGLFATTIDFGPGSFTGGSNWLEIAVRGLGDQGFATLTPRQQMTPTPYAITAENLASVISDNTIIPGEFQTIGGGDANTDSNYFSTVGGGLLNAATGANAVVAGGNGNVASGNTATVGGGYADYGTGQYSTVAGGNNNFCSNTFGTIGGGFDNVSEGYASVVAGGYQNGSTGDYTAIGGGYDNTASGLYSTVCGGYQNVASGSFSLAAGYQAQALQYGSFVWNDESGGSFASSTPNSFYVRANGGVQFNSTGGIQFTSTGGITLAGDMHMGTSSADYHHFSIGGGNSYGYLYGSYPLLGDGVHMGYNWYSDASGTGHVINSGGGTSRISAGYGEVRLLVGAANAAPNTLRVDATTTGVSVYGTFNNSSDRNAKQDFTSVNPSQILEKVLQLPVSEWSYKTDATTRHIGPMGQDFYSSFNIGTDEKHIAPIDEGGVALAAIQGLNQKLDEKTAEIQILEKKLDDLQALVKQLSSQK
jgi:hypothetical protein